ncbi:hypothetical protein HF086_012903 [Spodoptera exigua]|uniref:Myosin motor domain-containing protein n=1 Tax=Spodoptera exigua TaxID=7107 RepID=A0A922MUS1_SPOEX|nr:hypothetical protein HF086_012903 [Spodoptera exigua]
MGEEADVFPIDNKYPKRVCNFEDIFPAGDPAKDVDDNCKYTLTYVANILLAVNPYEDIPDMYSSNTIKKYQGKSLGELPPHVFAIADKAFRDMKSLKMSQSIIVSGESGAGKTESTKYILKYLCELWAKAAGPVEQKILDANPILEAFGNAKTTRNNNSSRFGKFMEVHFDSKYQVVGGHISHYLLEKSRICTQSAEERNYHVFYLLCAGAPDELRAKLNITKPDDYLYLKNGCTQYFTSPNSEKKISADRKSKQQQAKGGLRDPILDDVEDFQRLHQALARVGLSEEERLSVYGVVGGVLHLGNVHFEEEGGARGGCRVAPAAEPALRAAAAALGVDPPTCAWRSVPLKTHEANNARDALAKAVYSRLFDYIVHRINTSIPFQASAYYIGVLDIAGFEYFQMNSFEQFCINYCNEKLQQFFNERILKNEQELYKHLIESKNHGIFHLLDEESKLPKPEFSHFTHSVHKQLGVRNNRTKMRISYRPLNNQFIEKNNDALHASLEFLVQESNSKLVQHLFQNTDNNNAKGKLNFISVGAKFQSQLSQLMDKLKENGTNFVRCIKPNCRMARGAVEGGLVLAQLECAGTTAVLQLMEHGYPSRAPFHGLHAGYSPYLPHKLRQLSPKVFCEAIVHSLGLSDKDYKFGVTRVFFRPGKYSEFDTMMKSDPESLKSIVEAVLSWLVKSRWRKSIFAVLSIIKLKNKIVYRRECLILLQKTIRGHLARRKHRPRYQGLAKINALHNNLKDMETVTSQLKKEKDGAQRNIENLRNSIRNACTAIKSNENISRNEIDKLEEQERLRKMEAEMRAAEEAKKREQERIKQEEEHRRLKAEMEARRKAEEAERLRLEEQDRLAALKLQKQMEEAAKADLENRERLEQERRDHEMAVRLAKETNGHVEGSPPQLRSFPTTESINGENKLNRY